MEIENRRGRGEESLLPITQTYSCHGGFIRQQGIPSLACKHIWRRKSEAPLPQGGGVSWDRYRYHQGPQHPIKEAL